ncbi:hypothetical protein D029_4713B, partial [Vibrio parahaemolyticus 970107]
EIGK